MDRSKLEKDLEYYHDLYKQASSAGLAEYAIQVLHVADEIQKLIDLHKSTLGNK